MPIETNCPGCAGKVRVPESLLGKTVKCPKCKTTFTAEEPEPLNDEDPKPVEERPRRKRPIRSDDDYEEDVDDRPRVRRPRGRAYARSAVSAPAIGLMISGWIGIVCGILGVIWLIFMLFMVFAKAGPGVKINWGYLMGVIAGNLIGEALLIGLSWTVITGASKMRYLENRGKAKLACILGMLPCAGFCLLGLPFGIWGLIVLSNPEVDRAFSG